jgi:hypothetical protein
MGGGPDKETVLIVLWDPEPEAITAMLKRQFPHFDITYLQVAPRAGVSWVESYKEVPDGQSSTCLSLSSSRAWAGAGFIDGV